MSALSSDHDCCRPVQRTELVWPGKRTQVERVALPFQVVETINVSRATREETPLFASGKLIEDPLFAQGAGNPGEQAGWRNKLIWGDNKYVLASLLEGDPAIGLEPLAGKVDLIYIDPPFDTGDDFSFRVRVGDAELAKEPSIIEENAYRDMWSDGRDFGPYLQMIYERLVLMRELLADHGAIYVHIGRNICHYVKAVLDEVFGQENFLDQVVWKRQSAHSDVTQGARHLGRIHDLLLLYAKDSSYKWNVKYMPYDDEYVQQFYRHVDADTGRRFTTSDLTAAKPGGDTLYEWKGVRPYKGRYWAYSRANMEQFEREGRLYYTKSGIPRLKNYLDEMPGVPLQDIWSDLPPVGATSGEKLDYDTQKPEALLKRVLETSSDPGDLIADFFCGSGTTMAVAEKLGRGGSAAT